MNKEKMANAKAPNANKTKMKDKKLLNTSFKNPIGNPLLLNIKKYKELIT